jgi:hypothetical protein
MPFTVADFHDLVRLLEEHPDWRTELRRVLLSQDLLDLPRIVQELAIAQRHTEEAITRLTERMEQGFAEGVAERHEMRQDLTQLTARVEQGFDEAVADRQRIRERVEQGFDEAVADRQRIRERVEQGFAEAALERREMRQDIGQLKGMGHEQFYRERAAAIFGRLLSQGRDATNQVADQLQEARRTGLISDREYQEVLAADLLWGGQIREGRQAIVSVLEASWTVETADVRRAASRAAMLRRAGFKALPVAAGQEWPPDVQAEARRAGVAMVQDGMVNQASWETALAGS